MAPTPNPSISLAAHPVGYPDLGKDFKYDTSATIDVDSGALNGGFLTKTLYLSVDPYMRNRMRDGGLGGWKLGQLFEGFGISEVLRSETDQYKKGDILYGTTTFRAYNVWPASAPFRVLHNTENIPLSVYLGVAGMPGKTAYYGLRAIADPKAGESIFVSTAAGPVGQLVCQLAKAKGLRVLGSAGSDEKVRFLLEDLKIDAAFNYKTTSTEEGLKKFGGIDIYWDNVGGEMLDAALEAMNKFGRIVLCGHISMYNVKTPGERYGIKNTYSLLYKEVKMQGLYVTSYEEKYSDEFYATVPKMIAEGKIKYLEDVTEGLEHAPNALLGVLKGDNVGKAVVKVA
ncbi:NAD(P)-binding protein [Calocera viscosa TUFC12733]|uniref:NAD(P)-binding protein n=1 Tax=Calocera viscosa (strain TUFC12733) TaxID=1330018 RepID=A0A167GXN2_CALVF|nr:NAD(P)-binding protein [Calocera viscosa TUFC12733]